MEQSQKVMREGISVFDIDGCLFDDRQRIHLKPTAEQIAKGPAAAWGAYNASFIRDVPNIEGARRLKAAHEANVLIFLATARPVSMRDETINQIVKHFGLRFGVDFTLIMRPFGDVQSSIDLKRSMMEEIIKFAKDQGGAVIFQAFDDKPEVVAEYQALGVNASVLAVGHDCFAPEVEDIITDVKRRSAEHEAQMAANTMPAADPEPIPSDLVSPNTVDDDSSDAVLVDDSACREMEDEPKALTAQAESSNDTCLGEQDGAEAFLHTLTHSDALAGHRKAVTEHGLTGSWDIRRRLEDSAMEFQERAERYARNDLMYGQVMAALFPNGMNMQTSEDHRLGMFIMHIVGKLTRLAATGFAHDDSAKDLIAYAAMMQDTLETGRVV